MIVFIFIGVQTLVSLEKLGKVSIIVNELSVSAQLSDLTVSHHHYDITLREVPNPMCHQ